MRVLKGAGSRFKSRRYLRYLLQLMRWISSLLIIAYYSCTLYCFLVFFSCIYCLFSVLLLSTVSDGIELINQIRVKEWMVFLTSAIKILKGNVTHDNCLFTRLCENVSINHKYWYRIIVLRSTIYIPQATRTCRVLYAKLIPTDDITEPPILNYSVCTKTREFNTAFNGLIKNTFRICQAA